MPTLDEKVGTIAQALQPMQESQAKLLRETKELSKQFDVLNARARKHIAPSNFVFPKDKRYPIHDLAHARAALSRSSGKPEEAKVRAAVYRKYPGLKKRAKKNK